MEAPGHAEDSFENVTHLLSFRSPRGAGEGLFSTEWTFGIDLFQCKISFKKSSEFS